MTKRIKKYKVGQKVEFGFAGGFLTGVITSPTGKLGTYTITDSKGYKYPISPEDILNIVNG